MCKIIFKIITLTILITTITSSNSYAKKRNKKMIIVGIGNFQKALDPREAYNFHHFILIQCLMDTLVNLDESGNISSELAKSWKLSDDKLTYSFELNDKLKFQNGEKVTSGDVAFSISRHLWPSSNSLVGIYLDSVAGYGKLKEGQVLEGIKIESRTKFSIRLKRVTPSLLYVLTMPSFSIISKKSIDNKKVIGSGRMLLKKEKDDLYLETWNEYLGSKPKLDKIKLIEYSDSSDIVSKLNKNELDIVIGVKTDAVDELKNEEIVKGTVKTLTYSHLFYNISEGSILTDISFRKDLTFLFQNIAKDISSKTSFLEYLPTYFPKGIMPSSYYKKNVPSLMAKDFAKKWNSKLDAKKIRLALVEGVYPKIFISEIEELVKKNKLNIEVIKMNFSEYNERLKSKEYDIISGIYMGNFPDPDGFIEPIIQGEEYSFGIMPIEGDLDKIHSINKITDKYKRLEKYAELFKSIEDKYYFAPLFKDKIPLLYNKSLEITKSAYRYESELWKIFWKE